MEKEELMERIKRYEETIDYDFWFISSIKESVIEITDKETWEKVLNSVSSKILQKTNTYNIKSERSN